MREPLAQSNAKALAAVMAIACALTVTASAQSSAESVISSSSQQQAVPSLAKPADSEPILTLAEAVRLAANGNPQYQSAKLQALASLEQYKAQRTQYFPTLYTAGMFSELLNKVKVTIPAGQLGNYPGTGPIPATDTDLVTPRKPFYLVAGYAAQPLTGLIGTHYSVQSLRFMAESKGYQTEQVRQQQISGVKKAYTQVSNAEAQADSSGASLAAARETARIAHVRREQATVLESQVETADAQLASAEVQYQQDLDQVAQDKEKLNQLLGRDVMTQFTTERLEGGESLADQSDEELRQLALQNRPELKSDAALLRSGELQVKATQAKYIPDISASVVYIGFPSAIEGLPHSLGTAGAQLTWSPWDWGQKLHEARAQRSEVTQSRVQTDQDRNQIIAEVNQATRSVRQRRMQLHGAELNAKAKRSRLSEFQEQVRNQTALVGDLLQAQADDVTAQAQLNAARNNFLDAKTQLQQAIGEVQ